MGTTILITELADKVEHTGAVNRGLRKAIEGLADRGGASASQLRALLAQDEAVLVASVAPPPESPPEASAEPDAAST